MGFQIIEQIDQPRLGLIPSRILQTDAQTNNAIRLQDTIAVFFNVVNYPPLKDKIVGGRTVTTHIAAIHLMRPRRALVFDSGI